MSYIATDLATVPAAGFSWYMIFLEDAFEDDLRKDVEKHFLTLGREIGKDAIVVRGFDPTVFRDSVYEAAAFYDDTWRNRAKFPSLLVMDKSPATVLADKEALETAKLMIFPLRPIFRERGTLSEFFGDLVNALKSRDALEALEQLQDTKLQKGWGWLSKYVKIEPEFFGFGIRVNDMMRDLLARKSAA